MILYFVCFDSVQAKLLMKFFIKDSLTESPFFYNVFHTNFAFMFKVISKTETVV